MTIKTQIIVNMAIINNAQQLMLAMDPTDVSVDPLDTFSTFGAGNRARCNKAAMLTAAGMWSATNRRKVSWKDSRTTQHRVVSA